MSSPRDMFSDPDYEFKIISDGQGGPDDSMGPPTATTAETATTANESGTTTATNLKKRNVQYWNPLYLEPSIKCVFF
jgi:hypothetical protein